MKKLVFVLTAIFLCAIVAPMCSFGCDAFADDADKTYLDFTTDEGRELRLISLTHEGKFVGVKFSDYYFGTSGIEVSVELYSSDELVLDFAVGKVNPSPAEAATIERLKEIFTEIDRIVFSVDKLATTSYDGKVEVGGEKPISDVYRYNNAEDFGTPTADGYRLQIDEQTFRMMSLAQQMYADTDGAFNPAVYRLVDLWGFSSRIYSNGDFGLPYDRPVSGEEFFTNGYPLPDEKYIKAFSDPQFTDFSPKSVILEEQNGSFFVTKKVQSVSVDGVSYQQWIDLGGIAKGYAVDCIRQILSQNDLDGFFVDAGTSSLAIGKSPDGGKTALGVQDAYLYNALLTLQLDPCNVSTSGQYIRKYTVDGVEYAHILDGATGRPAQTGVKSVMVAVPLSAGEFWAAKGDCLTTALTVMSVNEIQDFINGYLKDNGIGIIAQYETLDGRLQLISNYSQEDFLSTSQDFDRFGWAMEKQPDGTLKYQSTAVGKIEETSYTTLIIVLGCLLGAAVIGLVVFHLVKGRKTTAAKVSSAHKDKPFKVCDILVYLCVVLVIVVLFAVFVFHSKAENMQLVTVVDDQTDEVLFAYNFTRGEYTINNDNISGWNISVRDGGDNRLIVRLEKNFDGETRFNELTLRREEQCGVKMTDSLCGMHRDCVRTFPEITHSGGTIVCSPNRLKVVTA